MKDIQLFQNEQFGQLRGHVDESGQPWFAAKDIAAALGYPESSLNQLNNLMSNVPEEWTGHKQIMVRSENGVNQRREMLCLNEQGVYFFLARSDRPKALPYQKWVAGEIMPSIRRTGGYLAAPADASPEEIMARALFVADDTIKRLKENKAALESKIETDRPKVIFADAVTASPKSILVRELAKYLKQNGVDIGQNRLFAWLREEGYIIKAIGCDYNEPTQKAMNLGLFEIKKNTFVRSDGLIDSKPSVRVTGKGQLYFVNKFLGGAKASSN